MQVHLLSKVNVGDLNVAFNLQHINLVKGLYAMEEVEHVLPIHKDLKSSVPTANWHLRNKSIKMKTPLSHSQSKQYRTHLNHINNVSCRYYLHQSTVPPWRVSCQALFPPDPSCLQCCYFSPQLPPSLWGSCGRQCPEICSPQSWCTCYSMDTQDILLAHTYLLIVMNQCTRTLIQTYIHTLTHTCLLH